MINTLNINFIRPLKLGRSGREQIVRSVGAGAQRPPTNQLPLHRPDWTSTVESEKGMSEIKIFSESCHFTQIILVFLGRPFSAYFFYRSLFHWLLHDDIMTSNAISSNNMSIPAQSSTS